MGTVIFNQERERMSLAEALEIIPAPEYTLSQIEDAALRGYQAVQRGDNAAAASAMLDVFARIRGTINAAHEKVERENEFLRHDPESFRSRAMRHGGC